MSETLIGTVGDYFSHPGVAGIDLVDTLKKGDRVHVHGHTTDLEFKAESLQIEHKAVENAGPGQSVGIKVPDRVRHGDSVYRVD